MILYNVLITWKQKESRLMKGTAEIPCSFTKLTLRLTATFPKVSKLSKKAYNLVLMSKIFIFPDQSITHYLFYSYLFIYLFIYLFYLFFIISSGGRRKFHVSTTKDTMHVCLSLSVYLKLLMAKWLEQASQ